MVAQLSTLILAYGQYENNKNILSSSKIERIPKNIRLFYYDFEEIDYDNYYLLKTYKKNNRILFFINKDTGKIFKKEFIYKELSPNEIIPKEIVLSFNNIKQMMNITSIIIHPKNIKQDFHNNGKEDCFVISLYELLQQLSESYNKLFPNETIEVHLSSYKTGIWNFDSDKNIILHDNPNNFTVEEKQNMENKLLREFIVVNRYPQAKFISDLAHKKTPVKSIIKKTRSFFSK